MSFRACGGRRGGQAASTRRCCCTQGGAAETLRALRRDLHSRCPRTTTCLHAKRGGRGRRGDGSGGGGEERLWHGAAHRAALLRRQRGAGPEESDAAVRTKKANLVSKRHLAAAVHSCRGERRGARGGGGAVSASSRGQTPPRSRTATAETAKRSGAIRRSGARKRARCGQQQHTLCLRTWTDTDALLLCGQ